MIQMDIEARNLPPIVLPNTNIEDWPSRRKELIGLFAREEYGCSPPPPAAVHAEVKSEELRAWAGKATHREVALSFPTPKGAFSFPVHLVLPNKDGPLPLFIHISFTDYPGGEYVPMEEIVDSGYAVALFCYKDVTEDIDDGFTSGLAGMYDRTDDSGAQWGKIAMWAWAASRVMDYVQTISVIDKDRIICVGHSRLGKTAIWCGVQDERFAAAVLNESGCSGAAITRGKQGERVNNITFRFPHWFCSNYPRYSGREQEMPFDQHQLLGCMAPRLVYVSSAVEDTWADPYSEFLSSVEAGKVYEWLGLIGLAHRDRAIEPGQHLHGGKVGYHLRSGTHFLSRADWQLFIQYMDKHLG